MHMWLPHCVLVHTWTCKGKKEFSLNCFLVNSWCVTFCKLGLLIMMVCLVGAGGNTDPQFTQWEANGHLPSLWFWDNCGWVAVITGKCVPITHFLSPGLTDISLKTGLLFSAHFHNILKLIKTFHSDSWPTKHSPFQATNSNSWTWEIWLPSISFSFSFLAFLYFSHS